MFECLCKLLKGLWCCFIGSLRLVFFLATLTLLLFAIMNTVFIYSMSYDGFTDSSLPDTSFQWRLHLFNCAVLILSFLGVYGSFFNHSPTLKAFSVLTVLNAIFIIFIFSRASIKHDNDQFIHELRRYQPLYRWDSIQIQNHGHRDATFIWNNIQSSSECCGIEGPRDWIAYRPAEAAAGDLYPSSCCPGWNKVEGMEGNLYCLNDRSLFKTGCHKKLILHEKKLMIGGCLLMSFELVLAIIAYFIVCAQDLSEHPQTQRPMYNQVHIFSNQPFPYQQSHPNKGANFSTGAAPVTGPPPAYPSLSQMDTNNSFQCPSYGTVG